MGLLYLYLYYKDARSNYQDYSTCRPQHFISLGRVDEWICGNLETRDRAHMHTRTHTTLRILERQTTHTERNLFLGNPLQQHVTSFRNWSVSNYANTFSDRGSTTTK
jgi:hypothetical protein